MARIAFLGKLAYPQQNEPRNSKTQRLFPFCLFGSGMKSYTFLLNYGNYDFFLPYVAG